MVLIESGRPDFNLASTERLPGDPICINSAFVDVSPRVWIPSVAADAALPFAVEPHAFAQAVVSAACAAVPSVVSGCRWRFSWQPARVPFPAAAGVSGVPDSVWRLAVLAVVGIFCWSRHCRHWASHTYAAAIRQRGCLVSVQGLLADFRVALQSWRAAGFRIGLLLLDGRCRCGRYWEEEPSTCPRFVWRVLRRS